MKPIEPPTEPKVSVNQLWLDLVTVILAQLWVAQCMKVILNVGMRSMGWPDVTYILCFTLILSYGLIDVKTKYKRASFPEHVGYYYIAPGVTAVVMFFVGVFIHG